jgi:Tetratricopeptide repeat.
MINKNNFYSESEEETNEDYPDYFFAWDEAINGGRSPGYYEAEELERIIEIYLDEAEYQKAKKAIDYALNIYPDNEDLIHDILLLLNDFEMWNDLLTLSLRYKNLPDVWIDGHRITALLHLGMEEDAFNLFRKIKEKYTANKDDLSVIYQAMGEALYEVDLFDASIEVMEEAIQILGENPDYYWLQLNSYLLQENKEKTLETAETISKMSPFDKKGWFHLGVIYKDMDELEKAIDAFEFALNLGYKSKNIYINLITVYELNQNFAKALEKVKEFMQTQIDPDNYLINLIAANVCSQMEMWKEAVEYISSAITLMPTMSSLYLYKSSFLLNSGEQKKAKLVLEEGIKKTEDPEGSLKKELERLNEDYPDN